MNNNSTNLAQQQLTCKTKILTCSHNRQYF